ncbi:uncharacterized protein C8Q71DRAFT_730966 [Rhodofomes roseus]|uniref:Uncharacterized protein n=1 Tax=Rhodofomes roseus TaxID=34475 RepID=A0A4Y9YR81_9APHY|nr:uncharacterized protein C8Q71DRAFT_730966 [Rhodofomes roseus]KAH9844026.1 hypothetical protein C8Q71DRAFT_730966 [Rhodofomes roseus]TFY65096.1 hypothetical protein EVJ58_g2193 [Rhodofomes roseus]
MRQASDVLSTSLRRASGAKRCASSASSTAKRPMLPVPKERMRALVSLYHQSDQFLTPSNLAATIDYEFITKHTEGMSVGRSDEYNYANLQEQHRQLKASPKIGDSRVSFESEKVEMWSGSRHVRDRKVLRALYGLEFGKRPGLDVLEEESERVRREVLQPDAQMVKSS